MLTEIDGTAGQYRSAQTALTAGDQPRPDAALAQADQQLKSANAAAQKYGMPPLDTCPEHESGTPAPARAPDPRRLLPLRGGSRGMRRRWRCSR